MKLGREVVKFIAPLLFAFIFILALWWGFLLIFKDIGPLIGQTPLDVFHYLFTAPGASTDRSALLGDLAVTLRDAALGFVAGMLIAIVVSALFVLVPPFENTVMPVAMLLRSVPLVAMTPVIVLVFGRDITSVIVMTAIIVFFPALVMIVQGLRSVPRHMNDVIDAYGGHRLTAMRMVAVPSSLPAIFSAAKVSVPGSLIGAIVGEWLGSGEGMGSEIIKRIPLLDYSYVWASIIVVTIVSIVLYALVGVVERIVLFNFGPNAGVSV